jgi:hypothetical protein
MCGCFGKRDSTTTKSRGYLRPGNLCNAIRYNAKFGPMAVAAAFRVAGRRSKRGPKYPTWTFNGETLFEVLKEVVGTLKSHDLDSFMKLRPTWAISMPSNKRLVKIYTELVEKRDDIEGACLIDRDILTEECKSNGICSPAELEVSESLMSKLHSIRPEVTPLLSGEMTIPLVSKNRVAPSNDKIIYYLHGGAYVLCSSRMQRPITWRLCHYSGFKVFSLDYR